MLPSPRRCLRERQLRTTHDELRRAAVDLVTARGFSAVSVQDISERAGVSPRTFFNHFRSKDEALVPDIPGFTPQQRQRFLDSVDVDLLTALEDLLTDHVLQVLDVDGPRGALHAAARRSGSSPELLPRTLAVFEAFSLVVSDLVAERTGASPGDLVSAIPADSALGAVRVAINVWSSDPEGEDLPTLLACAFSTLRGLAGNPGTSSHPPSPHHQP